MAMVSKVVNAGMTALMVKSSVDEYQGYRQEGDSKALALGKAVGSFALYDFLGVWGLAYAGVQIGYTLGKASGDATYGAMERAYDRRGKFGSGHVNMTQAGYTMRQRSLNAIRSNGMNLQSVLGNEARQYYGRT
jgi:hypothetical protein